MQRFLLIAVSLFALAAVADPKTLVDDEWVIKSGATQGRVLELGGDKPVQVIVEGVQDAKNGFTVRILPESVWNDYVAKKVTTKGLGDYIHGDQVMYKKTHTLAAGKWAVVVENTKNMFKSMSVRVKIIVDPKAEN